jgi:hypothetical protein
VTVYGLFSSPCQRQCELLPSLGIRHLSSNKKAKFLYRSLIDNIVQNPTDKFLKWEELLDIEITDWSEYFAIMKSEF